MLRFVLAMCAAVFAGFCVACGSGSPKVLTTSTDPRVIAKAKVEDERDGRVSMQMYEAITSGMTLELANTIARKRGEERSSFQGNGYTIKTIIWENWDGSHMAASFHGETLSSKSQSGLPSIPSSANHYYEAVEKAEAIRVARSAPPPKPLPPTTKPFQSRSAVTIQPPPGETIPIADDRKLLEQDEAASTEEVTKAQLVSLGRVRILSEPISGDAAGTVGDYTYVRVEDGSVKGKAWIVKTRYVK